MRIDESLLDFKKPSDKHYYEDINNCIKFDVLGAMYLMDEDYINRIISLFSNEKFLDSHRVEECPITFRDEFDMIAPVLFKRTEKFFDSINGNSDLFSPADAIEQMKKYDFKDEMEVKAAFFSLMYIIDDKTSGENEKEGN